MTNKNLPLADAPQGLQPMNSMGKGSDNSAIREALTFLRRRKRVVLMAFFITILIGVFITALLTPVWTSEAKLVVVTKSPAASSSNSGAADVLSTLDFLTGGRTVDTQAEIVNSPDILYPAFQKLTVKERKEGFDPQFINIPPEWSYNIVSKLDTDVIVITTKARNARIAAKFGNCIVETYLSQNLYWNKMATHQAVIYVEEEKLNIQKQLAKGTRELASYQKRTGLADALDQVSETSKVFVNAQNDSRTASADAEASRKRLDFIRGQLSGLPAEIDFQRTISENPEFTQVRAQIVQLENQLAAESQEYAPTSIKIKQDQDQLRGERAQLKKLTMNLVTAVVKQPNPIQLKLLGDFADATAVSQVADLRAAALRQEVAKMKTQMGEFPDEQRRLGQLQLSVDVLSRTLNNLSDRYYSLLIQEKSSIPEGIQVETSRQANQRSSPRWGLSLAFTFVFACLIAFTAGWIVDGLDTKIHSVETLEEITGLPILAIVPAVELAAASATSMLVIGNVKQAHSYLESIRLFRNNIAFASVGQDVKVLAVTSPVQGEGKSTVSQNLAIVAARDGIRVLVVDCDLRRPSVHKKFELQNNLGLTGAVASGKDLQESVQATQWDGVGVLTSGPLAPNPTEILNAERTRTSLKELAARYDLVVLDCPPCMGLSDMQILSNMADGIIMVTDLGSTHKQSIASSVHMLRQAGANILGIVVNRAKRSDAGYYGYYGYYSYYAYEEEADGPIGKKRKGRRSKSS